MKTIVLNSKKPIEGVHDHDDAHELDHDDADQDFYV